MAYNNYGNGGNGKPKSAASYSNSTDNVSSSGVSFTNDRAGKILSVNYWGRNVTFDIATIPAGVSPTWDVRKNAPSLSQSIGFHTISDLADICEDILVSIKSTGTFTPAGVRCGRKLDNIVEISNGSNIGAAAGVYLVIYKGLDNGNRTNVFDFYPFSGTKIVRDYNHGTGASKDDIIKLGEFKKFIKVLHSAEEAFSMAQAHAASEIRKNDKLAVFKAMSAMAASMGCDIGTELMKKSTATTSGSSGYSKKYQSPNGGGYQKSSSYNAPRNNGGQYNQQPQTFENPAMNYQTAIANLGDAPVDLNIDMSQLQGVGLEGFPS